MNRMNRRNFIKLAAVGGAALLSEATYILPGIGKSSSANAAFATEGPYYTYMPSISNSQGGNVYSGPNIIADHNAVSQYDKIPTQYKNLVKRMFANIPGESHSRAYQRGCELLQALDSSFVVNVTEGGAPEAFTDQHLRISGVTWGDVATPTGWIRGYGEEDWFTSPQAIQHTKDHLTYCNTHGLEIAAFGFAWCWDMEVGGVAGAVDPENHTRWGGTSVGGPDGARAWGLDAGDYSQTGNHVCMDTYLNATQEYIDHCQQNGYATRVFFTTGPVDIPQINTGEPGYQRELKHEYIRSFVKSEPSRILFDYADILCWNDAGQQNLVSWTDNGGTPRNFPFIHDDNMRNLNGTPSDDIGHIGERGALRLAKALWWMLARIAGWDGN